MNIKALAIDTLGKLILGRGKYAKTKELVAMQTPYTFKTGTEKRHSVIAQLEEFGWEVAQWVVRFGLECAVAYFEQRKGV